MSFSDAEGHARRVRSQRTAEAKLDELSKAIEELAGALNSTDRRLINVEHIVALIANR